MQKLALPRSQSSRSSTCRPQVQLLLAPVPGVHSSHLTLPGMQAHSTSPAALRSTQDLISRFQLLSAYDRYVRPHIVPFPSDGSLLSASTPAPSGFDGNPSQPSIASRVGNKGKEKEPDGGVPATPDGAASGAAAGDDDDEDGEKGSKKKKNSYRHLIKGVPGALSPASILVQTNDNRRQAFDKERRLLAAVDACTFEAKDRHRQI